MKENGEADNQGYVVWEAEIEWSRQVSQSWWHLGCTSMEMRSKLWGGLEKECSSQRRTLSCVFNSTCLQSRFKKVFGEGVCFLKKLPGSIREPVLINKGRKSTLGESS